MSKLQRFWILRPLQGRKPQTQWNRWARQGFKLIVSFSISDSGYFIHVVGSGEYFISVCMFNICGCPSLFSAVYMVNDQMHGPSVGYWFGSCVFLSCMPFDNDQCLFWQPVSSTDREIIVRLRNSILCLSHYKMMLYDTSVLYAFESSLSYQVSVLTLVEILIDVWWSRMTPDLQAAVISVSWRLLPLVFLHVCCLCSSFYS